MSSRPIRFFHRGAVVEVDGVSPTRTVLDWLREQARCVGTKEGCNEGDCGACTVVVGELPGAAQIGAPEVVGGLRLTTANACIQFLPALDGKALFTIEDLRQGAALHPVQQAMVECHASQCGFCTPGFAMSLWCAYEQHQAEGARPGSAALADTLAGNLCRCTGYRPILDAGERMFDPAPRLLDTAPVIAALRAIAAQDAAEADAGAPARGGPHHLAPTSLAALAATRLARPQARLLAGGTDIGLWVTKQFRDLGDVIWLGAVDELKAIEDTAEVLRIGAGVSLETAWAALAARAPALTEAWRRFAAPPVRHAGTMGGNVANGSPIGDAAPVLMALDAQLLLRCGDASRRLPLASFYTGYQQNLLQPGEFLQALEIPPAAFAATLRAYKISKRFDSDISAVFGAFAITLDAAGCVARVRLAWGGLAAVVRRAALAEAALLGQPWQAPAVAAAQAALAQEFTPLSDMRASAGYRMRVAQNLLQRFWLETRDERPLARDATTVWPAVSPAA